MTPMNLEATWCWNYIFTVLHHKDVHVYMLCADVIVDYWLWENWRIPKNI